MTQSVDIPPPPQRREAKKAVRASLSSLLATLTDGLVYQALLAVLDGRYATAAFVGAVVGAWCNFSLNRRWAFVATEEPVTRQLSRYAVMSFVTFLGLRGLLWLWVDVLTVSASLAWIPAKALAFACISYPLQRFWVFRTTERLGKTG